MRISLTNLNVQLVKASESKLKELMKIKSDDKYDEQSKFKTKNE